MAPPYTSRMDRDENFLRMAQVASLRGTCRRRRVGAVLVDAEHRVVSTGYNGAPSGMGHCLDIPCAGANLPSGTGLDLCEAIHAEVNAVAYAPDVRRIDTAYVTTAPCVNCTKLLLGTSCKRVVFIQDYPQASQAKALWDKARPEGTWINMPLPPMTIGDD